MSSGDFDFLFDDTAAAAPQPEPQPAPAEAPPSPPAETSPEASEEGPKMIEDRKTDSGARIRIFRGCEAFTADRGAEGDPVEFVIADLRAIAVSSRQVADWAERLAERIGNITGGEQGGGENAAEPVESTTEPETAPEAPVSPSEPPPAEPRGEPTVDVLKSTSIKGLGKGKLSNLCNAYPTIEDLRKAIKDARDIGKPDHASMPPGIGADIVGNIVEALEKLGKLGELAAE